MRRLIILAQTVLLLAPAWGYAIDLGASKSFPQAGKANPVLHNYDIDRTEPSDLRESKIAATLRNIDNQRRFSFRGAREVEVFRKYANSVVIVLTNEGFGSGIIITDQGDIITNWHVIEGNQSVGIIFKPTKRGTKVDKSQVKMADVIVYDEISDLALLRLRKLPDEIRPIGLAKMEDAEVGADVHAIGHPTGEHWTYTKGFISQIRKDYKWASGDDIEHKSDVIQTQTPINPGNSGGPLLLNNGKLVGVNSFKSSGESLNFAVSVNAIREFLVRKSNRIYERRENTLKKSDSCSVKKLFSGRNNTDDSNIKMYDFDCDGIADGVLIIPDDKSKPILFEKDNNKDGNTDTVVLDKNGDGQWDISYHDVDFDGQVDVTGLHPSGKIKADSYEMYAKD